MKSKNRFFFFILYYSPRQINPFQVISDIDMRSVNRILNEIFKYWLLELLCNNGFFDTLSNSVCGGLWNEPLQMNSQQCFSLIFKLGILCAFIYLFYSIKFSIKKEFYVQVLSTRFMFQTQYLILHLRLTSFSCQLHIIGFLIAGSWWNSSLLSYSIYHSKLAQLV